MSDCCAQPGLLPLEAALQRLLVARFGPLSQETQAALSTASTAQLEAWTDRFLSARTLDEVFAAPTSPSA